eukprot:CAMPEP_0180266598 /NCGR_PEP_ID=MMETSP0988-20121125/1096_1 /TAXON_ID=697907 /ORGANISM="non described non described, Strain CCMP2293" /LENGTH=243 /DNA_ID=CAMNT_0022237211 /DNA_START=189 /DNA_END=918 /DNA_ORIENTATION=-
MTSAATRWFECARAPSVGTRTLGAPDACEAAGVVSGSEGRRAVPPVRGRCPQRPPSRPGARRFPLGGLAVRRAPVGGEGVEVDGRLGRVRPVEGPRDCVWPSSGLLPLFQILEEGHFSTHVVLHRGHDHLAAALRREQRERRRGDRLLQRLRFRHPQRVHVQPVAPSCVHPRLTALRTLARPQRYPPRVPPSCSARRGEEGGGGGGGAGEEDGRRPAAPLHCGLEGVRGGRAARLLAGEGAES